MYIVTVWTYHPYKIEFVYRVKGSNFSVAVSRAIKLFRAEPRLKGKKFEAISVTCNKFKVE